MAWIALHWKRIAACLVALDVAVSIAVDVGVIVRIALPELPLSLVVLGAGTVAAAVLAKRFRAALPDLTRWIRALFPPWQY